MRSTMATINAIDKIVEKLNEISGIEFAKDAWVNEAPENYGVVELSGEAGQLWGDGHLTDSAWTVVVTVYVKEDNDDWPSIVRDKLRDLEDEGKVEFTHIVSRDFDYETGKVRWQWTVRMYGELTWMED